MDWDLGADQIALLVFGKLYKPICITGESLWLNNICTIKITELIIDFYSETDHRFLDHLCNIWKKKNCNRKIVDTEGIWG